MTVPDLAAAWHGLPYALGPPCAAGALRTHPEDFQVEERLPFGPSGEGEHQLLRIRKRGINTVDAIRRLAAFSGVLRTAFGYAGLKDRRAVATQWLSVHVQKEAPDWSEYRDPDIRIEEVARHHRKLQVGSLRSNRFRITLREVGGDRGAIDERLRRIAAAGVPNYFGAQRFGHAGSNLEAADSLLAGPVRRRLPYRSRLALSAARAFLFNQVLGTRVRLDAWHRAMSGDVLMLDGSRSVFHVPGMPDAEIEARIAECDLHPTAPLWGRQGLCATDAAGELEQAGIAAWPEWRDGLERHQRRLHRRACRVIPEEFDWKWPAPDRILCHFELPAGSYATAVLREVITGDAESPAAE